MKTEDFDDAIRRKLASINSTHSEQEVTAIYNYIQSKKGKPSRRRAAMIILASFGLLIIGSILAWNIYQVNEISLLKQHISQLTRKTKNESVVKKSENNKTISKVRKETAKASNHSHASPEVQSTITGTSAFNKTTASKTVHNHILTNSKKAYLTKKANVGLLSSIIISASTTGDEKNESSKIILADVALKGIEEEKKPKLTAEKIEVEKTESDTVDMSITNAKSAQVQDNSVILNSEIDSSLNNSASKHPIYPKLWNYRAGIGLEAGNRQVGGGLFGEAIYKKRIAISAGVKLLKNGEERFDDDNDYDDHKRKEFKKTYGNQVDDDSKNIRIRNTVVQIPITISYIFPLKANFSIIAGLGTDIDVYTKQHVEYRHANIANDLQTTQFVAKYPPAYFNNCVITGGIQKTIHRFVFQLSPYLSPQIKKVDYKKENCYYGLRFRTFFQF